MTPFGWYMDECMKCTVGKRYQYFNDYEEFVSRPIRCKCGGRIFRTPLSFDVDDRLVLIVEERIE